MAASFVGKEQRVGASKGRFRLATFRTGVQQQVMRRHDFILHQVRIAQFAVGRAKLIDALPG
jgi:hypothetical protein